MCQLQPEKKECIDCTKDDTKEECCKPYLNNPLLDPTAYSKCCSLYPKQKNCQCATIIGSPTMFKPSQLDKCCKDNLVVPDCCDAVRKNPQEFLPNQVQECCKEELFVKLESKDPGRSACCAIKPSLKGCTPPENCELGKDITKACCQYYSKKPAEFSKSLKACCTAQMLPNKECCCKKVMANTDLYGGRSSPMVRECCKFKKYKDEVVCDKCAVTPIPDNIACCDEIVDNKKVTYSQFTNCCLQESYAH